MPTASRNIGRVVRSTWDAKSQSALVELELGNAKLRVHGIIRSGPESGTGFVDPVRLRNATPALVGLPIVDNTGHIDPATLTLDAVRRLRLLIRLDPLGIGLTESGPAPDANTLLRVLFG